MIHLRDFKRGRPEAERQSLCGEPAMAVPTAGGCLEWWRERAAICGLCWDAWQGVVEKIARIKP